MKLDAHYATLPFAYYLILSHFPITLYWGIWMTRSLFTKSQMYKKH